MKTYKRSAYAKRYYRVVYRKLKRDSKLSDKHCKTVATMIINYSHCCDLSIRRHYDADNIVMNCIVWGASYTMGSIDFWQDICFNKLSKFKPA